jgi:hypothetical protein
VQQPMRHAPEEQARDRSLTSGAHHDEVRAGLLRGIGDRVCGTSGGRAVLLEAHIEPGVFQIFHLPLDLLLDFFLVDLHRVSASAARDDLLHVHDDETSRAGLCESPGVIECAVGVLGTVARPDDRSRESVVSPD